MTQSTCNHDKVYSEYILLSLPPQNLWICRKCLAEGTNILGIRFVENEYDKLLAEKKELEDSKNE